MLSDLVYDDDFDLDFELHSKDPSLLVKTTITFCHTTVLKEYSTDLASHS